MTEQQFDADYCTEGKHVAFPPSRICYCGSVYFFGPLPGDPPDVGDVPDSMLSAIVNFHYAAFLRNCP